MGWNISQPRASGPGLGLLAVYCNLACSTGRRGMQDTSTRALVATYNSGVSRRAMSGGLEPRYSNESVSGV